MIVVEGRRGTIADLSAGDSDSVGCWNGFGLICGAITCFCNSSRKRQLIHRQPPSLS